MTTFHVHDFVRVVAARGELVTNGVPVDYANTCGKVIDTITGGLFGSPTLYSVAFANGATWNFPARHLERVSLTEYLRASDPPAVPTSQPKPAHDFPGHPQYRIVGVSTRHAALYVELTTTGERRWVGQFSASIGIREAFFDASPTWAPAPEDMEIHAT